MTCEVKELIGLDNYNSFYSIRTDAIKWEVVKSICNIFWTQNQWYFIGY